ncbi:MFS transporter [Arsukibacterium sp.]|uniref:MFS transporter n=1 Tax=Arsukibacterium sp. TaxID=1977258 RepID=UPI00299E7C6A|nr:MFS transporter [Arsukibacterium sp.]MDX1536289.1 MFS transporter [Arsukibacterium sp.]
MPRQRAARSVIWHVVIIILAGELIFALPFHLARFFRPTFLQAFELSNAQLGDIFAVYGVVAMLCYFPGGIIADKVAPNRLMSMSLLATALGGAYMWTGPGVTGLALLFGYWGCTTILLFWAAMIKATRISAPATRQGLAFGVLDGGRGLVASVFASGAVLLLGRYTVMADGNFASAAEALTSLRSLIVYYSVLTVIAAALAWFFISSIRAQPEAGQPAPTSAVLSETLTNPLLWLQAGVVICAYCGYKSLDNYGLFVVQTFSWSQLEAAQFTTAASYLRPVVAVAAGLLADRVRASRLTLGLFSMLALSFISIAVLTDLYPAVMLLIIMLALTFAGVFALRAVYFALIDESRLRLGATGTAVGVISLLGFTPDVFFAPLTGRMLDNAESGFAGYFLFMALIMLLGTLSAWLLVKKMNHSQALASAKPV